MEALQLTRTPGDRRCYELPGVGTLRVEGWLTRRATATAGGTTWSFARQGFWQTAIAATDAAGATVGAFAPRKLRRGGTLRWGGRELELRPSSRWTERYALADGPHELAALDARSWGKRPVKVVVDDGEVLDPGLLLFATFVVRQLADDAAAAAPT